MRPALAMLLLLVPAASFTAEAGTPVVSRAAPAAAATEMRGLWVVRTALVSPETIDRVLDAAQAGGFNAIFVQVRGRGDAFYRSRLVARSPLLEGQPPSFDPLARVLAGARARSLEVHAWFNVLLTASLSQPVPPDNVVMQRPDWLMVPRDAAPRALLAGPDELIRLVREGSRSDPDVEGFYLSPSAPGVAEHLDAVVRELLASYAVDGLHLDFVRYPGPDYDYSRAALEAFRAGRDGDGLAWTWKDAEGWSAFRRQALSDLVARLSRAARRTRPGIVLSAAVLPDDVQAGELKFQSWVDWAAGGLLDAVCPMTYTPDTRLYRRQVAQARARLGGNRTLWAGVGAYRLPVGGVIEKISAARAAGASGVLVFSHESLEAGDLSRLRREAFPSPDGLAAGGSRTDATRQK